MHELSIAENILDIVRQHVAPADIHSLREVRIKVGAQAGIVIDSLLFSFEAITRDTPMQRARLTVEAIPYVLHCNACGETTTPDSGLRICPRCGALDTTVVSGTELQVLDLELDDEETGGVPR